MSSSAALDERNIRASYADGAAFSMMVGFGETYFVAFALVIGLSELTAGLLSSLPLVAGGVLQMASPLGARLVGSYKRWIVGCATIQACTYIPLSIAAFRGQMPAVALFALAAVYWGFGMAAGPSWNNWIDAIIPKPRLKRFLAVRSHITQFAAFVAFLIGGITLHLLAHENIVLMGFGALFAAAFVLRIISVGFLCRQSDVRADESMTHNVSLATAFARFREPQASRFLLFLLASQISVYVGAPFFSPFMLGHLHFSYAEYVLIISASYVAKILFYPSVARFVRNVGPSRALWIGALIIGPTPLFWFLTPNLTALVCLQVVAGVAWATFELSSTLLIFDRITAKERLRILTLYNFLNALSVVIGSVIGAAVLNFAPGQTGYAIIFTASAAFRLLSLTALFGIGPIKVRFRRVAFRTVGLRANRGGMSLPILVDIPNARDRVATVVEEK